MWDRWAPELLGVLVQLVVAAYVYGRLTEKTTGHSSRLDALDHEQGQQWVQIGDHGQRIAKIEGAHIHEHGD